MHIDLSDPEAIKITGDVLLQEAIDYFVAFSTTGTTTAQYRRIFNDLIREGLIDPDISVNCYLQRTDEVEASARKFSCLESRSNEHYNYNDKIYNMLRSFHAYLENPNCSGMKKGKKGSKPYRAKRKNRLTEEEAQMFFSALMEDAVSTEENVLVQKPKKAE
jgi:hypothetical protein